MRAPLLIYAFQIVVAGAVGLHSTVRILEGGAIYHGVVVALALGACALLVVAIRERHRRVLILLAQALLACGILLSFRWRPLWVFFSVSSLSLLITGALLFGGRARRLAAACLLGSVLLCLLALAEPVAGRMAGGDDLFREEYERLNPAVEIAATFEPDPRTTSALEPGARIRHRSVIAGEDRVEFDVTYQIGPDRARVVPGRPRLGQKWFIFGGSFTYGSGVDDEDTIPARIQAAVPSRQVYNFGVNGYGSADVLLDLRRRTANATAVELCAYLMIDDHVRRVACPDQLTRIRWGKLKPRFSLQAGGLKYEGKASETLSLLGRLNVDLLNRWSLYRLLFDRWSIDADALKLTERVIRDMSARCSEMNGTSFALVILPRNSRLGDISGLLNRLQSDGIPVLDLRNRYRQLLEEEGAGDEAYFFLNNHPRPNLNRKIAEWTVDFLRRTAGR